MQPRIRLKKSKLQVLASYGHVRDLVNKEGSVDPTANFAMRWRIQPGADRCVECAQVLGVCNVFMFQGVCNVVRI